MPLIKTRPGDLSYDVELVYRLLRPKLGWRTTQDFRDPDLFGVTVERTLWNGCGCRLTASFPSPTGTWRRCWAT